MATNKTQVLNQQILTPIKSLEEIDTPIIVQDLSKLTGNFVFLYDYQTRIYSQEAKKIMEKSPIGTSYNLPKGSFYDLKYSKGDVVYVVGLKNWESGGSKQIVIGTKELGGVLGEYDLNKLVLNVPIYVSPISKDDISGFLPTITIDNSKDIILKKVADTIPVTAKLGQNFGNNPFPKVVVNPTPTPTPAPTNTPVVVNGVEDTTETESFFDDKNNLLMIAGVLLIGYLLLNNKSE
jgi:hypothetical protein